MKTLFVALLLMASMVFVLPGCSDDFNSPVAPGEQALPEPSSPSDLAKCGIVHSAVGGGRGFSCPNFYPGVYDGLVTFSANQYTGGKVSGTLYHRDFVMGYSFYGKIIDMKVVDVEGGKQAKLGWEITYAKMPEGWPAQPRYGVMIIQDNCNGEGEFHTGIFFFPETGWPGFTAQQLIDMTPEEFIAVQKQYHAYGEWVRQRGEWIVL